jgi:7-keto-8-aminopelargonate synthetase-like enzyme
MFESYRDGYREELEAIRAAGTFKEERVISSPQSAAIRVPKGEVINFCANNYLGLADNPDIIAARQAGPGGARLRHGLGALHLRHLDLHKELERVISEFNGTDDTILYSSCFDANAASSRPFSARRTRSSRTSSTTPRSSTASACARRSASATPTRTWASSRRS